MQQPRRCRLLTGLRALLVVALTAVGPLVSADPPRPAPRLDLHGDPLPPGAVVRLGTVRFRNTWAGVFLPDGKRLATNGHGQVHLFDVATGKEAAGFPKKGGEWVSIAVSPAGTLLAALDRDTKTVVVWELPSGKEYRRLEKLEGGGYDPCQFGLAFSSDGKVLTGANGGITCSWDLGSGRRIRQFKSARRKVSENAVAALQLIRISPRRPVERILFTTFSPGGKYLAVGKSGNAIAVWDVLTGKLLRRVGWSGDYFACAAFSADGKFLVSGGGSWARPVCLWDVTTGKQLRQLSTELQCITSVAVAPDGKQVAAAGFVGFLSGKPKVALNLWDLGARTGAPRILPIPNVCWVQYSPDGKTLAWGNGESVRLIDRKSGKEIASRNAHRDSVTSVAYSPDGKRLATASWDQTVRVWEAATGKPLLTLVDHTDWVGVVAFSPHGRWLVSGDGDGAAILWDASTGAKKRTLKHKGWVEAVSFSPDGRSLATYAWPVQLWDLATGNVKGRLQDEAWGSQNGPVFSPDWKFLADSWEGSVRLRDRTTGKVVRTFEAPSERRALAFSPDSRTLASVTKDRVIVWELATRRERATFPVNLSGEPSSLVFSPDGTLLAFCDKDASAGRQVRVWDLTARQELSGVAPGAERVSAIAFSPDGNHLATASEDTTVLIWELSRRGR